MILTGKNMREMQASVAKTRFAELLNAVERGETVLITRHGRRIARIVPEEDRCRQEIEQALAGIRGLRRRTGRIALRDLLSAREEGHKF